LFGTFINALKITELRNRIGFTFLMILIFRLGCQIPTPGIDPEAMRRLVQGASNSIVGFFNIFSGGALEQFSIFALGIAPYINASIIMQLLVYVVSDLERMAKEEGEEGRKKISQYTRYGTVVIGMLQALGISMWLEKVADPKIGSIVLEPGWGFRLMSVLTLTTGTAFLMWMGEQMTAMGIGNGVSILITAGIVSRLPGGIAYVIESFGLDHPNLPGYIRLLLLMAIIYMIVMMVVYVQDGVRKIPVQHAKRMVGRRVYGGASTHIPLKVNQGGVIPVIFASSVLMFPGLIFNWLGRILDVTGANRDTLWASLINGLTDSFQTQSWVYLAAEFVLIVFFTFFYTAITMNPKEIADNLKKYGGFVPGIRAGRKTTEYIDRILNRITFAGGIMLGLIAIVPMKAIHYIGLKQMYFGGTSLLIVVGVALDTVRQMESHMVTRHYQGFMK